MIRIPVHADGRGSLAVAELGGVLPFPARRAYWIYGVPAGASRGAHAHRKLSQFIVCVAGSARVTLSDGRTREGVVLRSPAEGLLVAPMMWEEITEMTADCVLMVLADAEYDEADYIRDHGQFLRDAGA